jgi:NOL1/NOP2/fmu family ribosome biogenesis protein
VRGEGFSFFVLQKHESAQSGKFKRRKQYPPFKHDALEAAGGEFLITDDKAWYVTDPELFFRADHHLNVIKPGVEMGFFKKKNKLVPASDLALSVDLKDSAFEEVEVDYEQAIRYLRRDTFDLNASRGYNIVKYKGARLGYINHLGNRFNNMYPVPWRIRTNEELTDPELIGSTR